MLNLNPVKNYFEGYICRRCLNLEYGADLRPKDCRYGYVAYCPCCREARNIVIGLRPSGHRKMWFKSGSIRTS